MATSNQTSSKTGKAKMKKDVSREERAMKYKTFIGNKAEGQGFADKRKRQVMYQYRKLESKERQQMDNWTNKIKKLYADNESEDDEIEPKIKKKKLAVKESPRAGEIEKPTSGDGEVRHRQSETKQKVSVFHKEEKLQQEKKLKQEEKQKEMEAKAKARQEAQDKYQKEKRRKHKLLAKKNFKGQPNMSSRMDLLLEKIEKQIRT